MDKEVSGSFIFTFYDVISNLIPGFAFLSLLYYFGDLRMAVPSQILIPVAISVSYIIGQFLYALGILLYDYHQHPRDYAKGTVAHTVISFIHLIVKIIVRENYDYFGLEIKDEVSDQIEKKLKLKDLNNRARFQLCDALILEDRQPERETLLAKQGFYKSLSALIVIGIPYIVWKGGFNLPPIFWSIVCCSLLRLLLYVHTYFGEIRKVRVYAQAYLKLQAKGE